MEKLIRFFKDEEGATAVEYGIMVAAIAAVIVGVVFAIGGKVDTAFETVNECLKSVSKRNLLIFENAGEILLPSIIKVRSIPYNIITR